MQKTIDAQPVAGAGEPEPLHVPDDHFIPVEAADLVAAIRADRERFGEVGEGIAAFTQALEAVVDLEAAALRRRLVDAYRPFNPDRDTVVCADDGRGADACEETLWRRLHWLMCKANFARLGKEQIDRALREANSHGVRIRLREGAVKRLELYTRGSGVISRRKRHWRAPIRGREREYDVCRRFAVLAQLKDRPHVEVKLFRDIPVVDVEALLPHAEVRMGWLDRAQVAIGGAGALGGVAFKVIQGGALLASQMAWPLVLGLGGLSVRSFVGYRRAIRTRTGQRTQHLYFQNLGNNAAAIHALVGMVCGEELKEAILGYAFLASWRGVEPPTAASLRGGIEQWLRERFESDVRFDIADALETMSRLDLWEDERALAPVTPSGAALERVLRQTRMREAGRHNDPPADRASA